MSMSGRSRKNSLDGSDNQYHAINDGSGSQANEKKVSINPIDDVIPDIYPDSPRATGSTSSLTRRFAKGAAKVTASTAVAAGATYGLGFIPIPGISEAGAFVEALPSAGAAVTSERAATHAVDAVAARCAKEQQEAGRSKCRAVAIGVTVALAATAAVAAVNVYFLNQETQANLQTEIEPTVGEEAAEHLAGFVMAAGKVVVAKAIAAPLKWVVNSLFNKPMQSLDSYMVSEAELPKYHQPSPARSLNQ